MRVSKEGFKEWQAEQEAREDASDGVFEQQLVRLHGLVSASRNAWPSCLRCMASFTNSCFTLPSLFFFYASFFCSLVVSIRCFFLFFFFSLLSFLIFSLSSSFSFPPLFFLCFPSLSSISLFLLFSFCLFFFPSSSSVYCLPLRSPSEKQGDMQNG